MVILDIYTLHKAQTEWDSLKIAQIMIMGLEAKIR